MTPDDKRVETIVKVISSMFGACLAGSIHAIKTRLGICIFKKWGRDYFSNPIELKIIKKPTK
jgi:hypothetical protein